MNNTKKDIPWQWARRNAKCQAANKVDKAVKAAKAAKAHVEENLAGARAAFEAAEAKCDAAPKSDDLFEMLTSGVNNELFEAAGKARHAVETLEIELDEATEAVATAGSR
jgi:hypothetical protein